MKIGEIVEGAPNPIRVANEARAAKIAATLAKYKGKIVSQMTSLEQSELLEAMAQMLKIADENGVIT